MMHNIFMVSKEWYQLTPAEDLLGYALLDEIFHISNIFHIWTKNKSQKKKICIFGQLPDIWSQSDRLWGTSLPSFMISVAVQESQFQEDLLWWECPHCVLKVINLSFNMRTSVATASRSIYSLNTEKHKIRCWSPQVHLLLTTVSFKIAMSSWTDFCEISCRA